ncbi:hypothetical protein IGI04_000386 [Brassica rapa subsp. trilocularis]|uniref:UDP-glycosyltransferases domain-containing protein n=1 Tax=Brassica rapa subsp. trilocularis TaxID=1813537 RepID=A0ABQ7NPL4_BRACM|nr:hypothetical protein IGI04_000386 [Brassica rapa subsp. trilocularis]
MLQENQTKMSRNPHHELHVMFFPYMAYGHMIPTLDMAKLFSSKGVKSTIITTPLNSKIFQKPIDVFKNQNPSLEIIDIHIFEFPCVQLGLPEGCENVDFFTSSNNPGRENIAFKFLSSTRFFKDQLEKLLETTRPDCLIADMFFPWSTQVAEKCHVPRLVFHGTGYFSLCANYCMKVHKPQNKVASSSEPFVIPDLPGDIEITREQIINSESEMAKFLLDVRESETKSTGVIVNSFYELEPEYADFFKRFVAKRAWQIGPLSVTNRGFEEKAERGKKASVDESECIKWLDSKEKDSVIYISFGSVACFKNKQLVEIAAGLEASGASFIWVVRKSTGDDDKEEWLPEGFEERVKGRGMIIRGWAPQLFSSRGAKSTIITTPLNAKILQKPINTFKSLNPGLKIEIQIIDFPCVQLGLPEGCENPDFFTSNNNPDERQTMMLKFFASMRFFKDQLEKILETTRPSCLIADMFFPWATEAAEKFNVPRLVFHGTGYFSLCSEHCIRRMHKPKMISEPFKVPDLPGDITMTQGQMRDLDEETDMGKFLIEVIESEVKSSGVVVNSFYELEPEYADFYKGSGVTRAWHIGPLSVQNRGFEEKAKRGKKASIDEVECLKWLNSKKQDSVVYVSFGSVAYIKNEQLIEVAAGLEACGASFIWVVRKRGESTGGEEWLPEGFEERVKGRGLIIRGWAPQVMILDHQATGVFVTHCGWNSVLEGVAAGLPMVTWPVGAEQFYNEILVTQVLRTGVSVGTKKHASMGDFIGRESVEKAVREVLVGEEAEERRGRAKKLAEMAKAAVEEGGSSYNDLSNFIEEFST